MKLNNLQILRGISAIMVCCFHFRDSINFENFKLGDFLFINGRIGVQIFFIISGFIMTFTTRKIDFSSYQKLKGSIIAFYKKRIIRIVPLYYLLTFCWMVLGGSFILYFSGENWSRLYHSLMFIPKKDTPPVLYLGWSLNCEMFFYFIFGLSLLFKKKRYLFIVIFFIITYLLGIIFIPENPFLQLVCGFYNLYFVSGILLAVLLNKIKIHKKLALALCVLGVVLFMVYFFKITEIKSEFLQLIIVVSFVLSFLLLDFTFQLKGNKTLIFIGDISFSLYLTHPFVEILFRHFKIDGYLNVVYFMVKLIVVILVASISYYIVEEKFTNYLKQKLNV